MAQLKELPVHSGGRPRSGRAVAELVGFGVVAFAVILSIAASSISFEGRTVQPMAEGEAVPVRVIAGG